MTSFETGLCLLHRVSCLMSLVSSPITDKSSSAPLSLSRCIFLSSGSGQGTPEITRLGPGPASCQLTRKIPIPGLNWLTLAAKYFAKTDCEYFRNRNILGGGTGAEIYDRWCLGCGAVLAPPPQQFALFNGEFSHRPSQTRG